MSSYIEPHLYVTLYNSSCVDLHNDKFFKFRQISKVHGCPKFHLGTFCTTSKSYKIKQHYYECLLHISFLFNFFVANHAKHNDQQVLHLDFTFKLNIRKSQLPILLVRKGHVKISNLSMLLLPFHLSSCIILMSTHLIRSNR